MPPGCDAASWGVPAAARRKGVTARRERRRIGGAAVHRRVPHAWRCACLSHSEAGRAKNARARRCGKERRLGARSSSSAQGRWARARAAGQQTRGAGGARAPVHSKSCRCQGRSNTTPSSSVTPWRRASPSALPRGQGSAHEGRGGGVCQGGVHRAQHESSHLREGLFWLISFHRFSRPPCHTHQHPFRPMIPPINCSAMHLGIGWPCATPSTPRHARHAPRAVAVAPGPCAAPHPRTRAACATWRSAGWRSLRQAPPPPNATCSRARPLRRPRGGSRDRRPWQCRPMAGRRERCPACFATSCRPPPAAPRCGSSR